MKKPCRPLALILCLAPALGAHGGAQDGTEPPREDVVRAEEWPELAEAERGRVKRDVERLRAARTEGMGAQAHEALVADGAAVAPALLAALGRERDEGARARIVAVLDLVTAAEHTRLLTPSFEDQSAEVRVWSLRRVARFPDPGVRAQAEAALAAAREASKKQRAEQAEVLAAALAATSAGSTRGLDVLVETARERWNAEGAAIRAACEGARGPEASAAVVPGLAGERDATIAALNVLAGCGDRDTVEHVKPLLDSEDNGIRVAAINALRGMVDGEPPLDKLPVFDAIERAKRWKARV
jgi:hypothetical protein